MTKAKLHMICGNCGCAEMFTFEYISDKTGWHIFICCQDCGTLHDLEDNAEKDFGR